MAKASGVRRCVRSGCGTVLARDPSNSGHGFSSKILCAELFWGKQGRIAFRNTMLMQVWCRRTCGSKERGRRGTMCKFESKEVCESL